MSVSQSSSTGSLTTPGLLKPIPSPSPLLAIHQSAVELGGRVSCRGKLRVDKEFIMVLLPHGTGRKTMSREAHGSKFTGTRSQAGNDIRETNSCKGNNIEECKYEYYGAKVVLQDAQRVTPVIVLFT